MQAQDILQFWFVELSAQQRFSKDAALDTQMRERFGTVLQAASRGELFTWRTTPQGRLAEIIVLDQFSRNIHRDTPAAFAQDAQALTLAQELVASGQDYYHHEQRKQRCQRGRWSNRAATFMEDEPREVFLRLDLDHHYNRECEFVQQVPCAQNSSSFWSLQE